MGSLGVYKGDVRHCKAYMGELFQASLSLVKEHEQRKLKKLIEHLAKAERLGSLVLSRE